MSWNDEEDLNVVHINVDSENEHDLHTKSEKVNNSGLDNQDQDQDMLGLDEEVVVKKQRNLAPRLDEDKLINPEIGIPYLRQRVKTRILPKLKKTKGSEFRDLTILLQFYQLWAHKLYPRANFNDFIEMARKSGKTPRMRMFRQMWISEEKTNKLGVNAEHEEDQNDPIDMNFPDQNVTNFASGSYTNSNGDNDQVMDTGGLFVGDGHESEDEADNVRISSTATTRVATTDSVGTSATRVPSSEQFSTFQKPSKPYSFLPEDNDDEDLYAMPPGYNDNNKNTSQPLSSRQVQSSTNTLQPDIPEDEDLDRLIEEDISRQSVAAKFITNDQDIPEFDDLEELLKDDPANSPAKATKPANNDMDFSDIDDDILKNLISQPDSQAKSASTAINQPDSKHTKGIEEFEQQELDTMQDFGF